MDRLRVGILSTGNIAHMMAKTVSRMDSAELVAVASRDGEKARAFAQEYDIPKAYGSYRQLAEDKQVQLIYVASPHSHHYEHARLCIEAGKAVLCEKAFTANAAQARSLLQLAAEKKVFICEAMWTRFLPLAHTITRLVGQGAIGRPVMVTVACGQYIGHVQRLVNPALAGGALLDLAIYPLTLATLVLGPKVERITADAVMLPSGVDASNSITLQYAGGQTAVLASSMQVGMDPRWYVYGEAGSLEINGIYNPLLIRQQDQKGGQVAFYKRPPQITGYEYEVEACARALQEGRLECGEMPHAETLRMMEMMDGIRQQWGMVFPFEAP